MNRLFSTIKNFFRVIIFNLTVLAFCINHNVHIQQVNLKEKAYANTDLHLINPQDLSYFDISDKLKAEGEEMILRNKMKNLKRYDPVAISDGYFKSRIKEFSDYKKLLISISKVTQLALRNMRYERRQLEEDLRAREDVRAILNELKNVDSEIKNLRNLKRILSKYLDGITTLLIYLKSLKSSIRDVPYKVSDISYAKKILYAGKETKPSEHNILELLGYHSIYQNILRKNHTIPDEYTILYEDIRSRKIPNSLLEAKILNFVAYIQIPRTITNNNEFKRLELNEWNGIPAIDYIKSRFITTLELLRRPYIRHLKDRANKIKNQRLDLPYESFEDHNEYIRATANLENILNKFRIIVEDKLRLNKSVNYSFMAKYKSRKGSERFSNGNFKPIKQDRYSFIGTLIAAILITLQVQYELFCDKDLADTAFMNYFRSFYCCKTYEQYENKLLDFCDLKDSTCITFLDSHSIYSILLNLYFDCLVLKPIILLSRASSRTLEFPHERQSYPMDFSEFRILRKRKYVKDIRAIVRVLYLPLIVSVPFIILTNLKYVICFPGLAIELCRLIAITCNTYTTIPRSTSLAFGRLYIRCIQCLRRLRRKYISADFGLLYTSQIKHLKLKCLYDSRTPEKKKRYNIGLLTWVTYFSIFNELLINELVNTLSTFSTLSTLSFYMVFTIIKILLILAVFIYFSFKIVSIIRYILNPLKTDPELREDLLFLFLIGKSRFRS